MFKYSFFLVSRIYIVILCAFTGYETLNYLHIINRNNNELKTFWTTENVDYWSNFIPIPPSSDSVQTQKNYESEIILKQMAKLRKSTCVPKKGVFRLEDLILEKGDRRLLLNIIVPNQKMVLTRCLPQCSHCEMYGTMCLPTRKRENKRFAIFLNNITEKGNADIFEMYGNHYLTLDFEEHTHCSCQCPTTKKCC